MKTPMELALSKVERMKDIDPHSNRWEMFKKNCIEQEKTHIKEARSDGRKIFTFKTNEQYYKQKYNK